MKQAFLLASLGLATLAGPALAGPADYVYSPTVEQGEKEIDFKYGTAKKDGRENQSSLGFGWGVNAFWFTEAYVKWAKEPGRGTRVDALEWENKFQLTETGKYAVDVGLITEIEIPRESHEGKEFKIGPLFQTEFGKLQLNTNLLFERRFGGIVEAGEERITEFNYQWQVKYRLQPSFEFGAQGLGELGKWNHWAPRNEQLHSFGPAVFGKIDMGNHHKISYNAAYLFGKRAAPTHTFRLQVEYEF